MLKKYLNSFIKVFFIANILTKQLFYAKNIDKILCTILINMDNDGKITDEQYNKYFKSSNSIEGVKKIIKKNKFFINGFPIPGTESEFKAKMPEGYLINKQVWLSVVDGKYHTMLSHEDFDTYDEASFALATGFIAGLEVRLFDLDGDKFVDYIEMDYVESLIINEIIKNQDGTVTLYRSELESNYDWENDGRKYDGEFFSKKWNETIDSKNFDSSINKGDMVLFMFKPEGWIITRAKEVKGKLIDGADHEFYQIGDQKFGDAMRFSRDNIIISNRCGEYVNAQKYFNLLNMKDDSEVSLWFINSLDKNRYGAPCGFTSGKFAKLFLLKALEVSKNKLNSILVSDDGSNIEKGQKYVSSEDHETFKKLIMRAEKISETDYPNEIYDYNVYLLYLGNFGSQSDIGAQFAGFNYEGFDNKIQIK